MQADWDRITDWNAAYDNRAAVPTFEAYFAGWQADAAAFRAGHSPEDIAYGPAPRERMDLFRPYGPSKGLLVFLHGGWWSFFGREYFSHLAGGALARGWTVAIPSYTLCPDIRIAGIVDQSRQAVETASAAAPDGPLVIAGHSAGGHLTAMMGAAETGLAEATFARLARLIPISGVPDLRPLMQVAMNATLRIDTAEAVAASPLFLTPRLGKHDMIAWVGGAETPEFRRQNALLADMWGGSLATRRVEAAGDNHFSVIAPLANADSELTRLSTLG